MATNQCILGACPRDTQNECADGHCHQESIDRFDTDNGHDRGYDW